jgi:prevent-host-death family protein
MATDIPQRELRNHTADLLRRVEAGERLRITVHGHPVAELVPVEEDRPRRFVPRERFAEFRGILSHEEAEEWIEEIHQIRQEGRESDRIDDPFERYEAIMAEREREASEDR